MTSSKPSDLSLLDLLVGHRRLVAGTTLLCVLAGALVTAILPRHYVAEAKFLVRDGRENYVMTSGDRSANSMRPSISEEQVNSEIELLGSHDLLQQVVLRSGLYHGPMVDGAPSDAAQLERAVRELRKNLEVAAVRKTDIIHAKLTGKSPEAAKAALSELSSAYLAANIQAHGSPSSVRFFGDEAQSYRKLVADSEAKLLAFRRNTSTFDEEQQRVAMVGQLEDVRVKLADSEAEILDQRSRQAEIDAEIGKIGERHSTQVKTSVNQLLIDRLQGQLADLQNRKIELLVKFRPEDRVVTGIADEITNTERQLAAATSTTTAEQSTDINPLYQTLDAQRAQTRITLHGLYGRRVSLLAMRAQIERALGALGSDAITLRELESAEREARDSYTAYEKQREQARLSEAMDQQKIANVVVIETPSASPLPASPSLKLNLLAGAFLGVVLGLVAAYLLEIAPVRHRVFARRSRMEEMADDFAPMAVTK